MSLTGEDKRWIAVLLREQSDRFDARLREQNEHLELRLREQNEYLDARLQELREHLYGKVERVETSLLTEFHKWASPSEVRQRSHSVTLRALDMELEALRERVEKLEKGGSQGRV